MRKRLSRRCEKHESGDELVIRIRRTESERHRPHGRIVRGLLRAAARYARAFSHAERDLGGLRRRGHEIHRELACQHGVLVVVVRHFDHLRSGLVQLGKLLRRDHVRRNGESAPRPDGGVVARLHEHIADHVARHVEVAYDRFIEGGSPFQHVECQTVRLSRRRSIAAAVARRTAVLPCFAVVACDEGRDENDGKKHQQHQFPTLSHKPLSPPRAYKREI